MPRAQDAQERLPSLTIPRFAEEGEYEAAVCSLIQQVINQHRHRTASAGFR
jgi:hypothetical protein